MIRTACRSARSCAAPLGGKRRVAGARALSSEERKRADHGSFFIDGMATAAEQLCGRSVGARDRSAFVQATRLALGWGIGFGIACTMIFLAAGPALIEVMTTNAEVRRFANDFLVFAAVAPVLGALAYTYDGAYIGATWSRDMRNLMLAAFALYLGSWWALRGHGNAGLWVAILVFLAARRAAGRALSGAGARDVLRLGPCCSY
jgi:MATE family multidrug resistance protein